jgi:hypothetical protein
LLKEPLPLEVSRPSFKAPTIDLGLARDLERSEHVSLERR